MKIKTKLNLGVGLLFILIIILAIFGVNQINTLAEDSENILKDNQKTIDYTRNMLESLSKLNKDKEAIQTFENYLLKQKNNITEKGEYDLTENLSKCFQLLKTNPSDTLALENIQADLFEIMKINLQAIEMKNTIASKAAGKAVLLISFLSAFSILVALILFLKLPANISNPIRELTESIKQIAANNYSQRVNFEAHNEFGELAKSFNLMAAKLNEYKKSNITKLLAEKKITETLINKVPDPIIGFDHQLKVNFANEEFLKLLEMDNNQVIGKHAVELATVNNLIKQVLIMNPEKDKKSFQKNVDAKIKLEKNEKEIYFEKEIQEILYTPEEEKNERILGYVIILRNITKYMELDLAKTNFIATVSHELKTPISSLKLSLKLLENEKTGLINEEQKNLIKSCEDDTNHLLRIIAELLNLAQVETGNIQLNVIPSKPYKILAYAVDVTKSQAEQKGVKFNINAPEIISSVLADSEKTAWVLTNLISNAIRYSDKNSEIFLRIKEEKETIQFQVKDKGKGIPPEYQDKIFNKYFRVPGSKKEGTGLGLAISKEFIESQGGKITVESETGKGSLFSVYLNKA
ncbi:MAG: two-component system, NtrC family, sensor histidine kinase KinB [Bacteroidales bacterium]|nr:two-component system, NtrC family, sensor histidine kinase KinB [Bacteroidales bacterium]